MKTEKPTQRSNLVNSNIEWITSAIQYPFHDIKFRTSRCKHYAQCTDRKHWHFTLQSMEEVQESGLLPLCSSHPFGSISTWNALSLQWKIQPRASMNSKIDWGSNGLKDLWSFTFVSPWQDNKAAARPLGVKPAKCKIVMFCSRFVLARAKSPASVIAQYDKFICLRFWENWASGIIPLSLMLTHFFMSSTISCLHPLAIADRPLDETEGHPRISSAFNIRHFDKDINELLVILSL